MNPADSTFAMATNQNDEIGGAIEREGSRLRNFIRRRVPDDSEAEDILQDVFYELVEAYRLMKPVEQIGAWLFRVARNRITDFFRRKKPIALNDNLTVTDDGETLHVEDLLPAPDAGPEAAYLHRLLLEEMEAAIDELPAEQRHVFISHEIEGRSFKELAAETGVSVNTLLSRKHYAVGHLRTRLQTVYDEFTKS